MNDDKIKKSNDKEDIELTFNIEKTTEVTEEPDLSTTRNTPSNDSHSFNVEDYYNNSPAYNDELSDNGVANDSYGYDNIYDSNNDYEMPEKSDSYTPSDGELPVDERSVNEKETGDSIDKNETFLNQDEEKDLLNSNNNSADDNRISEELSDKHSPVDPKSSNRQNDSNNENEDNTSSDNNKNENSNKPDDNKSDENKKDDSNKPNENNKDNQSATNKEKEPNNQNKSNQSSQNHNEESNRNAQPMRNSNNDNLINRLRNGKNQRQNNSANEPNQKSASSQNDTDNKEPTNKSKDDVGSRKLKNSLANKGRNLLKQRRRKKDNEEDKKDESSENKNDDNEDDNKLSDNKTVAHFKRALYIRLALLGLGAFAIYFLVMVVASALSGGSILGTVPVVLPKVYDDESGTVTDEDSLAHQEEIEFYDKIKEVAKDNPDIDINYVIAILMDRYYDFGYTDVDMEPNEDGELSEEDLDEHAKKLEETGGIDYVILKNNVDKFVKIIKDTESSDYTIGGEIYQALKNSNDFKEYYKKPLENIKTEMNGDESKALDKILESIFYLAEELTKESNSSEPVVTDETGVEVIEPTSDGGTVIKQMSINDYLSGSLYATLDSVDNPELIKAYTIAASTNIVAQNKQLTIANNNAKITGQTCNPEKGCSYDSNGNLVDGPSKAASSRNTFFQGGGYYYKLPLSSEDSGDLNRTLNTVFGNVLTNSDGTYPTLDLNKLNSPSYADIYPDAGSGMGDYKSILKGTYGNYTIKNVGEGTYVLDASYGDKLVKREDVIFYDQNDYPGQFCGLKGATIKGSGCGVTATAIVVSTYEKDKKYDPVWANDLAKKNGDCSSDGTNYSHFTSTAKSMGYKSTLYSKNASNKWKISKEAYNNILKKLSAGNLIIINVMKGNFTNGGHYMVLGGIDPDTKKVYVYDPNNANNSKAPRNTGTGWYSFNDIIAPQTKAYIIIEKG